MNSDVFRRVWDKMSFLKAQNVPLIKMVYKKHTEYCPVVACTFSSDSWPYDDTPGSQLKAGDLAMRQLELHVMLNHRPNQPKESYTEDKEDPSSLLFSKLESNLMGRAEKRTQGVREALGM